MPAAADCSMRASGSSVRSTTSKSASSSGPTGSWPAARSAPWSFDPKSRSGQSRATRATATFGERAERAARASVRSSLRAALGEFLPDRLGPAPHLNDLHAPGARLAQRELALDTLGVEERERPAHRLRRGRVSELAG